jgi:hypothetical protein
MKRVKAILYYIITALCIAGCSSVSAVNSPETAKTAVIHEIKYSNKGSRSEGRSGYLKINGIVLPDCFTAVVVNKKVYTFKTKNTTWGDDGYFPLDGETPESVYPVIDKKINDTDLVKGWCEVSGRYSNVPDNWIFVKWGNGSAVLSPSKISELVKAKSLTMLSRNTMFKGKGLK